mmetsp:Transcript_52090/g.130827  ORF Transcript_52090/g.130827 Transcript_52090/m.130827 type:complete len:445 (-) Transcript_52090:152-1486(-)
MVGPGKVAKERIEGAAHSPGDDGREGGHEGRLRGRAATQAGRRLEPLGQGQGGSVGDDGDKVSHAAPHRHLPAGLREEQGEPGRQRLGPLRVTHVPHRVQVDHANVLPPAPLDVQLLHIRAAASGRAAILLLVKEDELHSNVPLVDGAHARKHARQLQRNAHARPVVDRASAVLDGVVVGSEEQLPCSGRRPREGCHHMKGCDVALRGQREEGGVQPKARQHGLQQLGLGGPFRQRVCGVVGHSALMVGDVRPADQALQVTVLLHGRLGAARHLGPEPVEPRRHTQAHRRGRGRRVPLRQGKCSVHGPPRKSAEKVVQGGIECERGALGGVEGTRPRWVGYSQVFKGRAVHPQKPGARAHGVVVQHRQWVCHLELHIHVDCPHLGRRLRPHTGDRQRQRGHISGRQQRLLVALKRAEPNFLCLHMKDEAGKEHVQDEGGGCARH